MDAADRKSMMTENTVAQTLYLQGNKATMEKLLVGAAAEYAPAPAIVIPTTGDPRNKQVTEAVAAAAKASEEGAWRRAAAVVEAAEEREPEETIEGVT